MIATHAQAADLGPLTRSTPQVVTAGTAPVMATPVAVGAVTIGVAVWAVVNGVCG